ncbi:MAG: 4-hydroxybenzoate octaprenyltransferase [Hyphomicrobiaceae bacterium]
MSTSRPDPGTIADAQPMNWVDSHAPGVLKPYFRLARYDRPIGTWLLLLPCWFGLALAQVDSTATDLHLGSYILFALGAIAMRGAGCTWNDIVDRKYDGRVERSALRPIPSGQVSVRQAVAFGLLQSIVGFLVLVQFNTFTIWLGISSLALVAVYPFAKRFTYWPQFVLGMTFNWGVLVGWSSLKGTLASDGLVAAAPLLLYVGAIAWTIGYDTIYAHQDKEDDALLGLKSTALRFGAHTPRWLTGFYGATISLWLAAAYAAGAGHFTYIALGLIAAHFVWQIASLKIDHSGNCLARFKSNRDVGLLLCIGLLLDAPISWS